MIFKSNIYFLAFIPLIITALFFFFFKSRAAVKWSSFSLWPSYAPSLRQIFYHTPSILQFIALCLIVTALARPQQVSVSSSRSMYGIDIMIAMDISFSMMVEDMNPGSRLSAAKKVITSFIDGLVSDRAGLVLFSGESYTKIPLTLDYTLLKEEIEKIKTSSDIQYGTAIGVALANAVARLRNSESKTRIIILLTDGENNAGNISPSSAVSLAQKYDIKIYSIGIGEKKLARIPIKQRDSFGREHTIYTTINSRVNKQLLSEMAQKTGGKFYFAKNLKNLSKVFEDIGKLEKSQIQVKKIKNVEEKFQNYLKPAFVFYLLSLVLSLTLFGKVI